MADEITKSALLVNRGEQLVKKKLHLRLIVVQHKNNEVHMLLQLMATDC